MIQQEKGHAQTSMIHSNLCKSRTLVKIAKGQAGHSILTSGPNLARGPGFEHPCYRGTDSVRISMYRPNNSVSIEGTDSC